MAGLTDMEELIEKVSEKEVGAYLREAFVCYSAGAHRACVVLTHIALFEGLRRKLSALAPINSVAKTVLAAIEPLASAQKVFETPLIHKMKAASLISALEAQILEQINNQRNKAAHPSGHNVTAEEARFVFSEAIQKFLSKPIRETSYIVTQIYDRLKETNFFPTHKVEDMEAIVEQEILSLDHSAIPYLIDKIGPETLSSDESTRTNTRRFLLALASKNDTAIRKCISKKIVAAYAANSDANLFLSEIISIDPLILTEIDQPTKLRVRAILLANAKEAGLNKAATVVRNPLRIFNRCVEKLGETAFIQDYETFVDWIVEQTPYFSNLISNLNNAPVTKKRLMEKYLSNAASSSFPTANKFASALPGLDEAFSTIATDAEAFRILAGVVRAAGYNAYDAKTLCGAAFAATPHLRQQARSFALSNPAQAKSALAALPLTMDLPSFILTYLPESTDVSEDGDEDVAE